MFAFFMLVCSPFILIGLADLYIAYRFLRKPEIDTTAGFTWYWTLKWAFASQTKRVVAAFPYAAQDLTEALGIRPDDGKTS